MLDDGLDFVHVRVRSENDFNQCAGIHDMFVACDVPERTRKMVMGGTLAKMLALPD